MRLKFEQDLHNFREVIFRGITSLLVLRLVHDKKNNECVMELVQHHVRSSIAKSRVTEVNKQLQEGNTEPLFTLLLEMAGSVDNASLFVKLFIVLLHLFSGNTEEEDEKKSILPRLFLPKLDDAESRVDCRSISMSSNQLDITNLQTLKIKDLQVILKERNLPSYGTKEHLIQRITKHCSTGIKNGAHKRKCFGEAYHDDNEDDDNDDEAPNPKQKRQRIKDDDAREELEE